VTGKPETKPTIIMVEFNQAELAVLLYEAMFEKGRPDDLTAVEALESLSNDSQQTLLRGAVAAIGYYHRQTLAAAPEAVSGLIRLRDAKDLQ
jgi:hypothetical protein